MTEDQFWDLVESTKAAADSFDDHAAKLVSRLVSLEPEEIAEFERIFETLSIRAYSWDLWGAAFLINGGCSDDGFTDFRSWLISMGRKTYEAALADPESLADIELDGEEATSFEEFGYTAGRAYRARTGKEMPCTVMPYPREPSGVSFEEESDAQAQRYPRLFAKYGSE